MKSPKFLLLVIVVVSGCEILEPPSPVLPANVVREEVILARFNPADSAVVGPEGLRVGGYYNLKMYDSISVNFSADRTVTSRPWDHILVKVGPAWYYRDSLAAHSDFRVLVIPSRIAKPEFAALVFFAPDSDETIVLTHLLVVGWWVEVR